MYSDKQQIQQKKGGAIKEKAASFKFSRVLETQKCFLLQLELQIFIVDIESQSLQMTAWNQM